MNREQHNTEQMRKADFLLDLPGSDEGHEFICPKECDFPEHHINLEYCPEEIATTVVGWSEKDVELKDFWNSLHDTLLEGDDTSYEIVRISESEDESRNLYAAWKGVQG